MPDKSFLCAHTTHYLVLKNPSVSTLKKKISLAKHSWMIQVCIDQVLTLQGGPLCLGMRCQPVAWGEL